MDGKYISAHGAEYPQTEEIREVSRWIEYPQMFDEITTYNELFPLPTILENTHVRYVFVEAPIMSATEQYQLMIASGEYPDVIPVAAYSGGASQAYVDEVIVPITPYLEESAPDYWYYLMQEPEENRRPLMNDGEWLGMFNYTINRQTEGGNLYRADWLRNLGIDPEQMSTLDGFTDTLYAIYDEYHPSRTYYMEPSATISGANIIFDTAIPNLQAGSGVAQYVVDGELRSGLVSDGYREYVEYFIQLYKDGLFGAEFYNPVSSRNEVFVGCANGEIFYYTNNASGMDDPLMFINEDNQDCEWRGASNIYRDESHENLWGSEVAAIGAGGGNQPALYFTENCEDIPFVLTFFNYFFTQPGYMISNYGVEGLSYNLDENGVPVFTEKVTDNDQLPANAMREMYAMIYVPHINNMSALNGTFNDRMLEALTLWTEQANEAQDIGRNYPTGAALTVDENSQIVNASTDVGTFAQEQLLKFMTASEELTDESWDAYVAGCYAHGLQDVLDVYQGAYDDWAAGNR